MTTMEAENTVPDPHRLPLDVRPTHYDLTVRTDLEKLEFDGNVSVHLEVQKDTTELVFHSTGLELSDFRITGFEHSLSSVLFDKDNERVKVGLPFELRKGSTAVFHIKFRGPLTGSLAGYYRSSWKNDGKEEYYSLTQFEATSARRAFPCWDEPLLKATFSIALISRENLVNLSNMNVESEDPYANVSEEVHSKSEQWKITRFAKTPPMSTYLVAYANGPFEHRESSYVSPLSGKTRPLRIYATKDIIHQVQFTLDVTQKVLPLYEKLFDIEYPLPKLDTLVAHDCDAAAMENWGLITGRTTSYCLDSSNAALHTQKIIAAMQSHETAHMWFGNITTMAWWDNLYLNEGFASLMGEVVAMDKMFPEWKIQAEFLNFHLNKALLRDAKLSSHPVEVECPDANNILQIFDAMSYSKAASVLRMLLTYVGEEVFFRGVSAYLKKHLYANSVSRDLWDAIGEAAGVDVTKMMQTWMCETGFPVVTVRETAKSIIVRQDRFLETGQPEEKDNQIIWSIPLNLAIIESDGQLKVNHAITLNEKEIEIPLDTSRSYKLNVGTSSYCRVLYPSERLSKLSQQAAAKPPVFPLSDRIGLVHDVFSLASAGHTELSVALDLVHELGKGEEEFLAWEGMRDSVGNLVSLWWEDDTVHDLLQIFQKNLYAPLVAKLGYDYDDNESPDVKQLRTLVISGCLDAGDSKQVDCSFVRTALNIIRSIIKELRRRFDVAMETGDESIFVAELETPIYVAAVRYGGRREYDIVRGIFDNPSSPSARTSAIVALCNPADVQLIEETFKFILTDVKEQDYLEFISYLSLNRKAKRQVAQFMMGHFDKIYEKFSGNFQLNMMISQSFERLTTKEDAEVVQEFFKASPRLQAQGSELTERLS
ncbi:hypothetical protein SCHPADRAFT_114733 [Schizopora paradoxa]|uniref:Aminopeptidase n=1 Tax=Schizopora paradoxa TaxID=27342 RepID=A0A0H2SND4_9AGAM|nr:hypothetical protein SCHPADRAFT_114733 [Schizopora paradoxa]